MTSILVLDDNFIVGSDIASILSANGYPKTTLVGTSREALEKIETDPIEAAIIDLMISGGQTTEEVGLALLKKKIPFFFLTGYTRDASSINPAFNGVHVQPKPYREADLLAGLAKILPDRTGATNA